MDRQGIEKVFNSGKNVYIVGIKGAGVSALAQILKSKGYRISGSDTHEKFFTDALLKKAKIKFHEGFSIKNLPKNIDWAISSNAYLSEGANNPEVLELKKRGIPLLSYPEALSHFFNKSYGIAVSGTHGKTTVTAILAFILKHAGLKPNALVGSEIANLKSNALVGKSDFFVLEADEYREQFLQYYPNIILILNTDWDHSDYFKSHAEYLAAFDKFRRNLKTGGKIFEPEDRQKIKEQLETKLIGQHNKENIKAAVAVARHLGVEDKKIREAVAKFKGTKRRLEILGKWRGNIIIDDYGHNPQKVAAGLKAVKEAYQSKTANKSKKSIVVFQPHTYSRTEQFLKDFAKSLVIADEVYLLDIYASAREAKGKVTSDDLVREIEKLGHKAINLKTIPEALKFFKNNPPKNSVIMAMGAGDVGDLAHKLVSTKK